MRKTKPPRFAVLDQAKADIRDRETLYGDPHRNHERIATLMKAWNEVKEYDDPTPLDSIIFQILTNIARLAETPDHAPTWENMAGYAAIGYEVSHE